MKLRISTHLTAEEIFTEISSRVEPSKYYRTIFNPPKKQLEGRVSLRNFEINRITLSRSVTPIVAYGQIYTTKEGSQVLVDIPYPTLSFVIIGIIVIIFLAMILSQKSSIDLFSAVIFTCASFVLFLFFRGKYIMDSETLRDEIFRIVKGHKIEKL